MSDLMVEAKEELRRENAEKAAKKAAPFVIGALVLAIAGAGGYQFWQKSQSEATSNASVAYYEAMKKMQSGDTAGGIAALEAISKTAPHGMASLAALQYASALQAEGQNDRALAAFDEAAKKTRDGDLADIARMRAAYIAAGLETQEKFLARLDYIIGRKGPFSLLARELKAANLWTHGNGSAAKSEYQLLQLDPNSPKGLRIRASQAISVIEAGAVAGLTAGNTAAPSSDPNVEIGADGKRIIRLPPGVKLPPGYQVPPNTRFIETPLPAGADVAANSASMNKEIEAERRRAMAEQEALTKSQQKQVDAIANSSKATPVASETAPSPSELPTEPTKQESQN